jgi:hypothetical protein
LEIALRHRNRQIEPLLNLEIGFRGGSSSLEDEDDELEKLDCQYDYHCQFEHEDVNARSGDVL